MRTKWLFAALVLFAPLAYGQASADPLPQMLERVKANVSAQCDRHRATLGSPNASLMTLEQARDGVEVLCNCFPAELERQKSTHREGSAEERAEAIARDTINACGVRQSRSRLPAACRADSKKIPDSKAREEVCRCIDAGVAKLTDKEMVDDMLKANAVFEARVEAIKRGDPSPPPLFSGAIANIEKSCGSP